MTIDRFHRPVVTGAPELAADRETELTASRHRTRKSVAVAIARSVAAVGLAAAAILVLLPAAIAAQV